MRTSELVALLVFLVLGVALYEHISRKAAAPVQFNTDFAIDDVPGKFARISYENGRVISFKPAVVNGLEYKPTSETGNPAVVVMYQGGAHRLDVRDEEHAMEIIEFIERHETNQ